MLESQLHPYKHPYPSLNYLQLLQENCMNRKEKMKNSIMHGYSGCAFTTFSHIHDHCGEEQKNKINLTDTEQIWNLVFPFQGKHLRLTLLG